MNSMAGTLYVAILYFLVAPVIVLIILKSNLQQQQTNIPHQHQTTNMKLFFLLIASALALVANGAYAQEYSGSEVTEVRR